MFPLFKRNGKMRAIVEYEFAAHRFKLFIPKESCHLIFSLNGVRGPGKGEPLFKESVEFVKRFVHLHEVEIEITYQDKNGVFFGTMWKSSENVAILVLDEGFGAFNYTRDLENINDYEDAELTAKRKHKNLWQSWDEAEEKKKLEAEEEERKPKQETFKVIVSEILDGSKFFVQILNSEFEKLETLSKALNAETPSGEYKPQPGDLVKAQFAFDQKWYRGKVVSASAENNTYRIFYVDYGNSEEVPASRIRQLDPALAKDEPYAKIAKLAFLRVPDLSQEFGLEAAEFVRDYVEGKQFQATQEYTSEGYARLVLGDSLKDSLNAAILAAGLARLESGKIPKALKEKAEKELRPFEDEAESRRRNMWEYGNPGSDDESSRPSRRTGPKKSQAKKEKGEPAPKKTEAPAEVKQDGKGKGKK